MKVCTVPLAAEKGDQTGLGVFWSSDHRVPIHLAHAHYQVYKSVENQLPIRSRFRRP